MVEGDLNKKHFFAGSTGWKIFWDAWGALWKLGTLKKENVLGFHSEFENYWKIINDSRCDYPNPDKILINMSPWSSSAFTFNDSYSWQVKPNSNCDIEFNMENYFILDVIKTLIAKISVIKKGVRL